MPWLNSVAGVSGSHLHRDGLPSGIAIASNGTISGSGNTPGTYTVTVTAKDTEGASGTAILDREWRAAST